MPAFSHKLFLTAAILATLSACSDTAGTQTAAASGAAMPSAAAKPGGTPAGVDARTYCVKLQPAVQSKMKIPLSLFKADDSHSDDAYADDPTYISCIFDSNGKRVTVIMRARNDAMERDRRNGLTPVSGYGDQAFYSGEKGGQLRWVDVVRGSDFCEALLGVEPSDLGTGDFGKTGGQICVAAFAAR